MSAGSADAVYRVIRSVAANDPAGATRETACQAPHVRLMKTGRVILYILDGEIRWWHKTPMDMNAQPILDLLSEAERKRDAALERSERAKLDADKYAAEADAYRRALAAIGFSRKSDTRSSYDSGKGGAKPRKQRPPSQKWVDIYTALFLEFRPPYDYQSILNAAEIAGHKISDGSMRTQMMNAVNGGLFERVGAGKFQFTDCGLDAIGAEQKENEPPEGGPPNTGEVQASPDPGGPLGMPGMFTYADSGSGPPPRDGGEGGD